MYLRLIAVLTECVDDIGQSLLLEPAPSEKQGNLDQYSHFVRGSVAGYHQLSGRVFSAALITRAFHDDKADCRKMTVR
jgi:hypothetical protein